MRFSKGLRVATAFRLRKHFGTFEIRAPAHVLTISTVSNLEMSRGFFNILNTFTR